MEGRRMGVGCSVVGCVVRVRVGRVVAVAVAAVAVSVDAAEEWVSVVFGVRDDSVDGLTDGATVLSMGVHFDVRILLGELLVVRVEVRRGVMDDGMVTHDVGLVSHVRVVRHALDEVGWILVVIQADAVMRHRGVPAEARHHRVVFTDVARHHGGVWRVGTIPVVSTIMVGRTVDGTVMVRLAVIATVDATPMVRHITVDATVMVRRAIIATVVRVR